MRAGKNYWARPLYSKSNTWSLGTRNGSKSGLMTGDYKPGRVPAEEDGRPFGFHPPGRLSGILGRCRPLGSLWTTAETQSRAPTIVSFMFSPWLVPSLFSLHPSFPFDIFPPHIYFSSLSRCPPSRCLHSRDRSPPTPGMVLWLLALKPPQCVIETQWAKQLSNNCREKKERKRVASCPTIDRSFRERRDFQHTGSRNWKAAH